ncbi:hypothetical protein N7451_012055 [Penicillium sp. IBT 35674x]|nr:hypothetical protein N7451_012055 [Penicillium sp. IBT 35674x]
MWTSTNYPIVFGKITTDQGHRFEHIAVDPDFYSLTTCASTDPEDFQSETASLASAIVRGRFENGRRSLYFIDNVVS